MPKPIKHSAQDFCPDESPALMLDTLFNEEIRWNYDFQDPSQYTTAARIYLKQRDDLVARIFALGNKF